MLAASTGTREHELSREQLRNAQAAKLRAMFAEIAGRNAFYARKFRQAGFAPGEFRDPGDLASLPFTTRDELLLAQEPGGVSSNLTYPASRYIRLHQTSGTSGTPLRVFDTAESWDWWGRCWARVFGAAGITSEDRIFCAFSFGPFIGFWAAVEGARQIGALLVPGGGRSSIERLHLMRETGCTVVCCTPSYALRLMDVAEEHGFDLAGLPVHTLIHAGEPGANIPEVKGRIESGWSARCFDHAGASEVGAFAFESRDRPGGVYLIEEEFIAEIIAPGDGRPVTAGEIGELVLTNLGRAGFPAIRYRTGDLVRSRSAVAEEGLLFLEGGIIGRADDMVTVRGVNIYPGAIDGLVRALGAVTEYRATVDRRQSLHELVIEIETRAHADAGAAERDLQELIRRALGLRPRVMRVESGTLPRFENKARRFHLLGDRARLPGC
jgi:phenylacetate-CoA ligase